MESATAQHVCGNSLTLADGVMPLGTKAHSRSTSSRSLPSCRLFVDVGAEIGYYSYLAVKYMPAGSNIIAFEPEPIRYATLSELFAEFPQVRLVRKAISDSNGWAELTRPKDFYCATMIGGMDGEKFLVKTIRLDDVLRGQTVDILKMDIEGAEAAALLGAERLLRDNRPRIYLETHPWIDRITPGGLAKMEDLFRALNYRIFNADYSQFVLCYGLWGSRFYMGFEAEQSEPPLVLRAKVNWWIRARQWVRKIVKK